MNLSEYGRIIRHKVEWSSTVLDESGRGRASPQGYRLGAYLRARGRGSWWGSWPRLAHVAWSGYHILPFQLVWNLIWAPHLGLIVGYKRGAEGVQDATLSWKPPSSGPGP